MMLLAVLPLVIWLYLLTAHGRFWHDGIQPPAPLPDQWPDVAAVIPARDEAAGIAEAVTSLLTQDYHGALRVIVVDDQSSDNTAAIAQTAAAAIGKTNRLTVIAGRPLPAGWSGKLWAVSQGLAQLSADIPYVLMTDADIAHAPDALSGLVARAESGDYDLVSLMVRLRCQSFAERLLIPAFVLFFQMLYPFAWVRDSAKPWMAGAAGGTMLVRRAALEQIGGIAAIKGALIDDCSLAKALKAKGKIWLGLAEASRSLREYPDIAEVWRMVVRTAYTQLNHSPLLLAGCVVGMAITFPAGPLLLIGGILSGHPLMALAGGMAWAAMALAYIPTLRYYRQSLAWAPALPLVALIYTAATLDSARRHWQGKGGQWKGRVQGSGLRDQESESMTATTIETPSGKTAATENFPVGSVLIRPDLRAHVHAYYQWARTADDIGDNPHLAPADKVARLDEMERILVGTGHDAASPAAMGMRESLRITGLDPVLCTDLLVAFRQDATKLRYADWGELLNYCRYSASPVGRYLLALHGVPDSARGASDALCDALQVLNHLQDIADDYHTLDRIYLPQDIMAKTGAKLNDLNYRHCTAGLRDTIDQLLDLTQPLIAKAQTLAVQVPDRRLRAESAIIAGLAMRLAGRLRQQDPLTARVKLSAWDVAAATLCGLWQSLRLEFGA